MIVQKIIEFFLSIALWFVNLLPDLNFEIDNSFLSLVGNVFYGVGYFIPIRELMPIFVISFGVVGFRVVWAIILRIKSFIPTMGD